MGAAIDMPRPSSDRYDALDALRGFALFGIFVINIIGFGIGTYAFGNPYVGIGGGEPLNVNIWYFTTLFVEGSMRGLFSLMFGAGVVLFTARAAYPDGPIHVADLHYRRMIWLMLFGLVDGWLLLAPGDILFLYGVMGLFLFPLRILSPRQLFAGAAVVLGLLTLLAWQQESAELALGREAMAVEQSLASGELPTAEQVAIVEEWQHTVDGNWPTEERIAADIANRTGDLATLYRTNAQAASWGSVWNLFESMLDAGLMMLIGMALMKLDWLTGQKPARPYALMAVAGYGIGLALRGWLLTERVAADLSPIVTWPWIFEQAGRMALALGHAGLFLLVWQAIRNGFVMRALAAAGRMAFTNYLGQAIIANLVFSGVGLGLYAQFDRAGVYVICVAIFAFQVAFSLWWLSRYRFGPLEWVWRSLTYGERQPMRLPARAAG